MPVPPRRRVVSAAAALFASQGYVATSVRQIARAAGVSLDTVYACGGKADIFLTALETVLSGTSDGTPLLDAPDLADVWQAATLQEVVTGLVAATVAADRRGAGIWPALAEGARSDPALARALVDRNDAMRAEGRRVVEHLKRRGLCAAEVDADRVADLVWADAHPDRYALLVGLAGWSPQRFADELTATVLRLLS